MLEKAINDCEVDKIQKMYLHVLCSNESAIEFYKNNGFKVETLLENYYTDLDPPHCYILSRQLQE